MSWVDKLAADLGITPPKLLMDKEQISILLQFVKDEIKSKLLAEYPPRKFLPKLSNLRSGRLTAKLDGTWPTKGVEKHWTMILGLSRRIHYQQSQVFGC